MNIIFCSPTIFSKKLFQNWTTSIAHGLRATFSLMSVWVQLFCTVHFVKRVVINMTFHLSCCETFIIIIIIVFTCNLSPSHHHHPATSLHCRNKAARHYDHWYLTDLTVSTALNIVYNWQRLPEKNKPCTTGNSHGHAQASKQCQLESSR